MLRKWNLDRQCQKAVVIVVAVDDRKFWVARGPKVPVYGQELTDIFSSQVKAFLNMICTKENEEKGGNSKKSFLAGYKNLGDESPTS